MSAERVERRSGRKTPLLVLAVGFLTGGSFLSFVALADGRPAVALYGVELSMLLVLVALFAAVLAAHTLGGKIPAALCVLVLAAATGLTGARMKLTADEPSDDSVLPPPLQRLVPLHTRLAKPQPGDWRKEHGELDFGQRYDAYVRTRKAVADPKRNIIYICPLDSFKPSERKILELGVEYTSIWFQLPVRLGDNVPIALIPARAKRQTSRGTTQILTAYVLEDLLKPRLPDDAAALVAVTATDLWPGGDWNFVYGQAVPSNRVGVWSIHRFGDSAESDEAFRLALRRTLRVMTHETGHLFSLEHCIDYECCMCGANNRDEMDRHPLWLCPQCLAKLCYATKADPEKRFKELIVFAKNNGLLTEEAFWRKSLAALQQK